MSIRILFALILLGPTTLGAATLDRVRASGELRLGFREDAAPFAYRDAAGEPAGYSVALCRAVAASLEEQLGLDELTRTFVPVTVEDRFEAVARGEIDLLCGAATQTLGRRELVDFSLPTFVDGASVLYREGGPATFQDLAGSRVGVLGATTTEAALRNSLDELGIEVEVVTVERHDDGLAMLEAGGIEAYFADRAILVFLATRSRNPEQLLLSERYFTIEPHGLALAKGDGDFRLAVDRALSRIYRSGEIARIFEAGFGPESEPSELLEALYIITGLPE